MTDTVVPCLVCEYERETTPPEQELPLVLPAVYDGVSLIFEYKIAVCEKHKIYITDEFPETLKRL